MLTKHLARNDIDDIAFRRGEIIMQELAEIPLTNETYARAAVLIGHFAQTQFRRDLAGFGLGHLFHREKAGSNLLFVNLAQEIGLVFVEIEWLIEILQPFIGGPLRVMAHRDCVKPMLYDDGVYSIEDAAAMMVVYFLHPETDDVLLDICAAPGGKSIGASIAMEDQGTIIANDISYPRAKAMSQNVERMGRGDIIVASNDFVFSHIHFHNTFDKIIVDAPCSGSAMMRKNPEAKADWKFEKVKSNARKQLDILDLAYDMNVGSLLWP